MLKSFDNYIYFSILMNLPKFGSLVLKTIQSYEFEFSVEDEKLARELMTKGGETLELHYKEYFGALPWRGFTKFIVDSIVSAKTNIQPELLQIPEQL